MLGKLMAILSSKQLDQDNSGSPGSRLEDAERTMVRNTVTSWKWIKPIRANSWIIWPFYSFIRFSGSWCFIFLTNTSREIFRWANVKRNLSSWILYLQVLAVIAPLNFQPLIEETDPTITKLLFAESLNRENKIKRGGSNRRPRVKTVKMIHFMTTL